MRLHFRLIALAVAAFATFAAAQSNSNRAAVVNGHCAATNVAIAVSVNSRRFIVSPCLVTCGLRSVSIPT